MKKREFDPYLTFNGNCAEAIRFYEKELGAEVEQLITFAESPMAAQVPAEFAGRIMHARLLIDGQVLMASDAPPGMEAIAMSGFSLSLNYPTVSGAKAAFEALGAGGTVMMPLEKTFWAEVFGMVTDQFGVPWMIGCEPKK